MPANITFEPSLDYLLLPVEAETPANVISGDLSVPFHFPQLQSFSVEDQVLCGFVHVKIFNR